MTGPALFTALCTALCVAAALAWAVLLFGRAGFWRIERAAPSPAPPCWPRVVAIVPARDEAAVIADAVASLMAQDYPGALAIVVVDDHSTDGTGVLARRAAEGAAVRGHARPLDVVSAAALPAGWSGKVWAQAEGVRHALATWPDTTFFWLTDADIVHAPAVLRRLVARAEHHRLDLVSRMARLRCLSPWERAIVPAFVFFFAMLYPFRRVNDPRRPVAAAAGGCMLVRAAALRRIGGMAAIRGELIDDCSLAARIKTGGPIELELAQESVSLRPYEDWRSLWQMIARSAYTQLRYSPLRLLAALAGMALVYLAPPVLALAGGTLDLPAWARVLPWLAWAAMALAWQPMLHEYGQPAWMAPLLPLVALFFMGATWASAWRFWRRRGGQWKGRMQAPMHRDQRR